jgi:hypothetical protein
VRLRTRAADRRRDDVVAQPLHERRRPLVLRGGARDHCDRRRVAGAVDDRRGDRCDVGRRLGAGPKIVEHGGGGRLVGRERDGDHQRAVEALAEALGKAVVGHPLGGRRGLRAVVGLPEAQAESRRGERQQDRDAGDGRRDRPRGDTMGPARGETFARRAGGGRPLAITARQHTTPGHAEQRRHHGHGGDGGRGHHDAGGEPHTADERDANGEQAADRDHDDRARGEHRHPGGRVRGAGGGHRIVAGGEPLAVAGDEEQRVVDAGAQAEHHADRRRDGRHVDPGAGQGDERQAADEAEARRDERQRHRHDRAEQ